MPVVPATQEAGTGGLLEQGSQGCSELSSCHCTAAWAMTEQDPVSNAMLGVLGALRKSRRVGGRDKGLFCSKW